MAFELKPASLPTPRSVLQKLYLEAPSLLSSQSEATVSPQEGQVAGVSHPPPCVAEVLSQ